MLKPFMDKKLPLLCGALIGLWSYQSLAHNTNWIDVEHVNKRLVLEALNPKPAQSAGHSAIAAAAISIPLQFELNSAILTQQARSVLDIISAAMDDASLLRSRFVVEGHTDVTGSWEYNLKLSYQRAQSVVKYLSKKGVASQRLTAAGYGSAQPLVGVDIKNDRQRRVTIVRQQ